jgi:prepilin-type N-terminal cleavage/methylation domain-containing protein
MSRSTHSNSRQGGFSLIECLIAAVVASLGFMTLSTAQIKLAQHQADTLQRDHAVRLAVSTLEDLRWSRRSGQASAGGGQAAPSSFAGSTFTTTWRATPVGSAPAQLEALDISVQWFDREGQTRRWTIASLHQPVEATAVAALTLRRHGAAYLSIQTAAP